MDKYYVDYEFGKHDFIRKGEFDTFEQAREFASQCNASNLAGFYIVIFRGERVFSIGISSSCDFSSKRERPVIENKFSILGPRWKCPGPTDDPHRDYHQHQNELSRVKVYINK